MGTPSSQPVDSSGGSSGASASGGGGGGAMTTGTVVGIAVGGVVLLVFVVAGVFYCSTRGKMRPTKMKIRTVYVDRMD